MPCKSFLAFYYMHSLLKNNSILQNVVFFCNTITVLFTRRKLEITCRNISKYGNMICWEVLVMAFWDKQVKITQEELGNVLFYSAVNSTLENIKDIDLLKDLDLEEVDKNHLFYEFMIIYMFTTVEIMQTQKFSTGTINNILDYMHKYYNDNLKKQSDFSDEDIKEMYKYICMRYEEYRDVIEENRQGNWLQALSQKMLANLKGLADLESVYTTEVLTMTVLVSSQYKFLPDLISKYKLVL